jgi:hypothetical protein
MADVIAGQDAAAGWDRLTETDTMYLAGREKEHPDQVPADMAENTLWNLPVHLESPLGTRKDAKEYRKLSIRRFWKPAALFTINSEARSGDCVRLVLENQVLTSSLHFALF